MTMELFLGALIALTLAAVIIVLMTTNKRMDLSDNDRERLQDAARRRSRSDQNA